MASFHVMYFGPRLQLCAKSSIVLRTLSTDHFFTPLNFLVLLLIIPFINAGIVGFSPILHPFIGGIEIENAVFILGN